MNVALRTKDTVTRPRKGSGVFYLHENFLSPREGAAVRRPLIPDPVLFGTILLLVGFSLLMLYSTTAVVAAERSGDEFYYVKRQAVAAVLGLIGAVGVSLLPIRIFERIAIPFFLVCLIMLALVAIPGIGELAGGARRWIRVGGLRFQPAEIVKLGTAIYLARYFARHEARIDRFGAGFVRPLMIAAVPAALLLVQPDFGSAAIISSVAVIVALTVGVPLRYMVMSALGLGGTGAALVITSPYRMQRVLAFMSPFEDSSGRGYQLIQSLIAVGSGSFSGLGLGESQQKLFFLPAAHTDFLFAVVAEELGFLGAAAVIALFCVVAWRGIRLASLLADRTFSFCLTVAMTALLVVPAFLNMGVVLGVLPTKGLVLPLLGYGGSSLIASLVAVGILQGLHRSLYD